MTNADLEAETEIVLQPIFRLSDKSIVAFEALARWCSPSMGSIPPHRFIPIAERSGMIHRLTLVLFAKSIHALSGMPDHIGLSFNLSTCDITSDRTVLSLITAIRQSRIDPKRITFEITETAVVGNYDHAEKSMRLLRTFGSSLALDDFGTGYSSLGYLHRLPIDRVKVDRSFVSDLSRIGNSIVGSILALCEKMDLECIVEGVEEEAQLRVLRSLGAMYAQGILLGRPMSADDARHCVRAERDRGKVVAQ